MLIVVNYHYVRTQFDFPHEGIFGITPEQFENQIQLLATAGTFITGSDLRAAVRGEKALPDRALLLTADDGLREHYEKMWPIMRRLGIPGLFYVNTHPILTSVVSRVHKVHLLRSHIAPAEFLAAIEKKSAAQGFPLVLDDRFQAEVAVQYRYDAPDVAKLKYLLNLGLEPDRRDGMLDELFEEVFPGAEARMSREMYLTREQISELAAADAIGNHSHEHLPLGLIPPEEARRQLQLGSDHLEAWTGRRPYTFSYPYGSRAATSPMVGRIAAELGFDFGFTMERGGNPHFREPVHLARFDTNDLPGGKKSRWSLAEMFEQVPIRSWYGN